MKTFYFLLANTIISSVTNFTVWFALVFFLYLETQSVLVTSVISGLYLLTVAISGFWFGGLVDKHKKKGLMLASSAFSFFMFVIGFIIYITAAEGAFKDTSKPTLWIFIPIILFGVIAGNIRNIALPTLIPLLAPKDSIDKANGLAGTASGVSFLIVSVISGFLVAHSGMYLVLILASIFTAVSIAHLLTIKIPEQEIAKTDSDGEIKRLDIRGTIKIIAGVPGLLALIFFTTFNNFLGGVFMSLMDAYGLSLVEVEVWGLLWGGISCAFIVGGLIIAKKGLGKNPLKTLFIANITIWIISSVFTLQASIVLLSIGMFIYLAVMPFIEASEHTIIQRVVPQDRLGRVFGFAQSIEQAASPLTAFAIGPLTQLVFIPFMSEGGEGARLIGSWFGTGPARGMALVFTLAGIIGLITTILMMRSKYYRNLSDIYQKASKNIHDNLL